MPAGMVLRSGCNWHLDPAEHDTLELFLAAHGRTPEASEPIPLDLYLEYAEWFQRVKGIRVRSAQVARLEQSDERFVATLDDGSTMTADRVLLALGFAPFANVPGDLAERVPAERSSHTCDCTAPSAFHGLRVLIVGGRQSAFETAALLAEAGAASVYVSHRHETPSFAPSDWAWVDPLLERMGDEPTWYRNLSDAERKSLDARFWSEGRLKLEPWLGPRVQHPAIAIRAKTRIAGCDEAGNRLRVRFDAGDVIDVDHVMYATGYKVDMQRVEMLKAGGLIDRIECRDGSPRLDDSMQTTVPGLFVTSLPAARDFGLFFAFTAAVRASARIVGRALHEARR
jgi:cation diffusion facilitator CzcD-associated flavoprotein CzcO